MITDILSECSKLIDEYPVIGLAFILLTGLLVYYQLVVVRPVILHCKPTSKFTTFLRQHLTILNENYWPTIWCYESRFQTVFASIVRSTIKDINYNREVPILMTSKKKILHY